LYSLFNGRSVVYKIKIRSAIHVGDKVYAQS
jgi:hypothetical protein